MHLLHAAHTAHAVALLILVVVPFMAHCHLLFPQALQPLAVGLDACESCGVRRVVPENIAHVVEQPGG